MKFIRFSTLMMLLSAFALSSAITGCNRLGYGDARVAPEDVELAMGPKRLPVENPQALQAQSQVLTKKGLAAPTYPNYFELQSQGDNYPDDLSPQFSEASQNPPYMAPQ